MSEMVKDHKKDVADFTKESDHGKDADVKQFAAKTLPTLKEHVQEAQRVTPSAKSGAKTSDASR